MTIPLSPVVPRDQFIVVHALLRAPHTLGRSRPRDLPNVAPGQAEGHAPPQPQRLLGPRPQDGMRLHDLSRSFASRALALGEGLAMIGDLLGHRKVNTTARYAHLAWDSVRDSSATVAGDVGDSIVLSEDR